MSEKGSVCSYWTGSAWDQTCTVYKITATNTTCHCYDLSQALRCEDLGSNKGVSE